MQRQEAIIDWSYEGKPDFTVGTGALKIERYLVWLAGSFAAAIYLWLWYLDYLPWSDWQYLLAAFIALDVFGGVVANALNSCKRFYHTPSDKEDPTYISFLKTGINFDLLHIHTLIVAALYPNISRLNGFIWYISLIGSVLIVYFVPLYLKRPIAFLLISIAIVTHQYLIPLGSGFEWLIPLIFLKIVYGHSVREEPYRPKSANIFNNSRSN